MAHAHQLVNELADLTALRDQELLGFSLLKTLDGYLQPVKLRLLTLDGRGRPLQELAFSNRQCSLIREPAELDDDIRQAIDSLGLAPDAVCSLQREDGLTIVHAVTMARNSRDFLVIHSRSPLSKLNAHLVAGLLQIYRNFCELLQESQCDPLTGLANRKFFDDSIQKLFRLLPTDHGEFANERRAAPTGQVWLAMIDIDHFKQINDRFGHLYGDEVLLLLAQQMRACFRDSDLVFRFGGEEFVVVLRCPDRDRCAGTLDRFRSDVETRRFPQVGTVTISIGVAELVRDVYPVTLLDYADQALYFSKRSGRNRITFFEDMLASGEASIKDVQAGGITYL